MKKFMTYVAGAVLCAASVIGVSSEGRADTSLLSAAGEVFLKGSIDGKQMLLVLGMEKSFEMTKDIAKWAVKWSDLVDLGHDVYNSEHQGDVVYRLKRGYEKSVETAPEIWKAPWKSIQKIPGAFRVNMDNANDAFYHTNNPAVATLRYGGWATWAYIQGGYYLVIEAPAQSIWSMLKTVGEIPAQLAWQGLVIGWDVTTILFKYTSGTVAAGLINTYAAISATTATALTLSAGGAIAAYYGAKWMVYDLPRQYYYPVVVKYVTQFSMDHQQQVAAAIQNHFQNKGGFSVEMTGDKYQSMIKVSLVQARMLASNADPRSAPLLQQPELFAQFWVHPEKGRVVVLGEIPKAYFDAQMTAAHHPVKADLKRQLGAELMGVLQEVEHVLSQPASAPVAPAPSTIAGAEQPAA